MHQQIIQRIYGSDSDFLISPISIAYALMMTNSGASGQTSDEILSVLNISNFDLKELNQDLFSYIQSSKDNNLIFGNSIWIQNDKCYMPNKDYLEDIESVFNGKISFVNFYHDRFLIIDSINVWVNNMTNGLIKNIVTQEDIKLTTAVADKTTDTNQDDGVFIDDSTLDGIEAKISLESLKRKMLKCAKDLQFEQAAILRDKIKIIEEAL